MIYVLYSGIRGQSDRRAGKAAAVVAGEDADLRGERISLSAHALGAAPG